MVLSWMQQQFEQDYRREQAVKKQMEKMIDSFAKHGITLDDFNKHGQEQYENGWREGAAEMLRTVYGAVAIATHDQLVYGAKRITRLLNQVDQTVLTTIDWQELYERVEKETGYKIVFSKPFDRVEEEK